MTTFTGYGFSESDPASMARALRQATGIQFEERESEYRGEYWRFRFPEVLDVERNYVDTTVLRDWNEERHKAYPVVLYVRTDRPNYFDGLVAELGFTCVVLRREQLED